MPMKVSQNFDPSCTDTNCLDCCLPPVYVIAQSFAGSSEIVDIDMSNR